MNMNVLASYTQNMARGPTIKLNKDSGINAVYNECLVVWVGDHSWGWGCLNVLIFRYHYWPAQSATRLYWQEEGPMFSYYL